MGRASSGRSRPLIHVARMDGTTLIFIEMALAAVICLGFGFQQLWSLRRENRRAAEAKARQEREGLVDKA
jgi:hypothetical protein